MTDVFIVADIKLYREGLAHALERGSSFNVVATAARPAHIVSELAGRTSAVLLLDVGPAGNATDLAVLPREHPGLRVVALGVTETEPEIIAFAEAGVSGYLTRDASITELVATIEAVIRGELICPPRITAALMHRVATLAVDRRLTTPSFPLSPRELEVVGLIDAGLSNQEIAGRLFISLATVKNHVHNILDKLGVATRADAAAWLRRHRIEPTMPAAV
jgi:two-component system, NarL family, nitrate/nitrite response regulator NarL